MRSLLIGISMLLVHGAFAAPASKATVSKEDMLLGLASIENSFEVMYAPAGWKKSYANWDLDNQIAKAKAKINSAEHMTLKDYQKILRDFFKATQDFHVAVRFNSTESARLPFEIRGVDGVYYIVAIDSQKLSSSAYPIAVGDELVSFDGKPTGEIVKELQKTQGKTETDRLLAESMLTARAGRRGDDVPQGPVMIEVKSQKDGKSRSLQLIWDYTPEQIVNPGVKPSKPSGKRLAANGMGEASLRDMFDKRTFMSPMRSTDADVALPKVSPFAIGSPVSFVPDLGKKTWQSKPSDGFYGYIYKHENGKRIGVVRIPSYDVEDSKAAQAFAKILQRFNKSTDALVIDEVNNPGGSVLYVYALLSMLTDQALYNAKHRMTISQADIQDALQLLPQLERIQSDAIAKMAFGAADLFGYPVTYQFVRFYMDYLQFTVDEWNAGKTLTEPHHLMGVDRINPSPVVTYAKPLVVLVNELDFSGGDFFPAILQDNKRAVIFGAKTSGAGGYVLEQSFPNQLGVQLFTVTGSIAERIDKKPIENLGVTPDVPYTLTKEDVTGGFQGYKKALNATVAKLFKD